MIAWNLRGSGKKSANKELKLLCKNVNPDIIFLSETKMNKDMADRKLRNMGFPCTFNVPSVGRSGSLAFSWKKEVHLNIISSSMRGIYVTTADIIHSKTCHIHFIYGEPNSSLRQAFWEQQCQQTNVPLDEPDFFIGDFNALLGTEDKNGGLEVDDPDFENLRNFCSVFNLHDPGFSGPRFTWSNMQQGFNYGDICMPRPFHFMAMWIEDPTCRDIISNSWSVNVVGSPAYKLKAKILSTKKGLRDWNKSSFGNIQTNISTISKEFGDLQISNPTDTSNTSRLKARLEYLYNLEELYWKDKSREVWLLEGDRNSPYFHRVTLFRRKINAISWIKNSSNIILTDRDSIGNSFIDYFKGLYSSHPQQFQDEILADLPVKFLEEDNISLNMPLTPEEIKNAIFQMGGKKAPGPDGFTGQFYQKHWNIVGDVVVDMTQTCFRTSNIAKVFNHTIVALIPKVPLAELSAFISKRSISDNIFLANEVIHAVNHNDKVEGITAIKLDMSKAYDKLEWGFLEKVLTKMGLSNHWIKLINQCVSTVSYSVLLNGNPPGFFQPERGIMQGDPLSPYLYIICSEALSSYIDSLHKKGRAWDLSKNDKFSSKSAYLGLRGLRHSPSKNLWRCIWKVRVPYRIQVFLWREARNVLPSRTVIHTRMPMHSVDCPRCSDPQETIMHALVTCPFASKSKLSEDD
ncbi:uncharacterized protein LOC113350847 [Papaver somniferum]|uniref:uncharacterized protein LOC113350847 n=1 Tax=Papaver somniferum TaxID=3469 RepID=UPI000E6FD6D1|nr:uncharacterized protein LOC113350847 [Papaver somniferum]